MTSRAIGSTGIKSLLFCFKTLKTGAMILPYDRDWREDNATEEQPKVYRVLFKDGFEIFPMDFYKS
jgi:hypothetical protein